MVSTTTTDELLTPVPNPARAFYNAVYEKTKSVEEATRQTTAKFGPPPAKTDSIQMPGNGPVAADASTVGAPPGSDPTMPWAQQSGVRDPSSTISGPSEFFRGMGGTYANAALFNAPNALGFTDPNLQARFAQSAHGASLLATGAGLATGGKAVTEGGKALAARLIRMANVSAKTANLIAGYSTGMIPGAIAGAANSENHPILGGLVGAGLGAIGTAAMNRLSTGAVGELAKGIKQTVQPLDPKYAQQVADGLWLDALTADGPTQQGALKAAMDQVDHLANLAVPGLGSDEVLTVADAAPSATNRLLGQIPGLTPSGQGSARAAGQQLLDQVAPLIDRKKAVTIAVKDMGMDAKMAKNIVDLLEQTIQQKRALAQGLLDLADRDPAGAQKVIQNTRGTGFLGKTVAKVADFLTGHLTEEAMMAQHDAAFQTALHEDPIGFLGNLQQSVAQSKNAAAHRAAIRGFLGMLGTRTAASNTPIVKNILPGLDNAGSPGTTITPR